MNLFKTRWIAGAALSVIALIVPALAGRSPQTTARKLVAMLPATVAYGAQSNGPPVSLALRERMERLGFDVIQAGRVDSALRARGQGENAFLSARDLSKLRSDLSVDFVAYPRVLSVGTSLGNNDYGATIILNIGGASSVGFAHTRQINQIFGRGARSESPTIDSSAADAAAERLLQGFERRSR